MDNMDKFDCIAKTYNRLPIEIIRGEGVWLFSDDGRRFLDLIAGIAVCNLGHVHNDLLDTLKETASNLWHTSNLFWTMPQARLAKRLCELSFGQKVFFCNSGAESVEAAIKLMRRYGHIKKGASSIGIIALERSFHGRTMGALSVTGQPKYQLHFGPLLMNVTFIPPNDIDALMLTVSYDTCGIILEPVQGEGGVYPLDLEFIKEARRLCNEYDILLCFDEVQTGIGRTGRLFAYEWAGIEPDLMCLAKGLSNGLPIGALVGKEEVMEYLPKGTHASTFGGGPIVCEVAHKVLDIIGQDDFLSEVREKGGLLKDGLLSLQERFKGIIKEVRGMGLMLAVEFNKPLKGIGDELIKRGILALTPEDRLLRLIPPLIIGHEEIGFFLSALEDILKTYKKGAKQ